MQDTLTRYYDENFETVSYWRKKNKYFYNEVDVFHQFLVAPNQRVIEVGAGTGDLLASLNGSYSLAVDFSKAALTHINGQHPQVETILANCEDQDLMKELSQKDFDYVISHGLLSLVPDIQKSLRGTAALCRRGTKIIVSVYNSFWEPFLRLGTKLGMRSSTPLHNWLSDGDLNNLFFLEDLEVVSRHSRILCPIYIPLISWFANKVLIHIPGLKSMCLMHHYVLRKRFPSAEALSVSIVIPARNEAGNIENAVLRLPEFGSHQEIIFVEGNSTDNTWSEIERIKNQYSKKNIVTLKQRGKGKGDAVRLGFQEAKGDILFILDADLTVPPEDLPKFYEALRCDRGEFINGTRLVYPMEKQAMRFLNLLGNKFFAKAFSWLLNQEFKDTLCGTKVLKATHYEKIANNRAFFGDFDPFGDFDLLFGASKQNFKIIEIPIRYKERTYGETNISRFSHGWLLLKMCFYAAKKLKLR